MIYSDFRSAIHSIECRMFDYGKPIHTETWQSIDISGKPEAEMRELLNVNFSVPMEFSDLNNYRLAIEPNLPWADRHFELERVSGEPINPGETWKEWPYGHSADKFRRAGERFSHTYAERYWPKRAGNTNDIHEFGENFGMRYKFGDLNDVVDLLAREPLTRQAYLPVWFPEDTGVVHRERVPCTLGYHFIQRGGLLHVFYPIRSCDLVRHFRDDIYLTIRLVLWLLDRLKGMPAWSQVHPGMFTMWVGSLHCFIGDINRIKL